MRNVITLAVLAGMVLATSEAFAGRRQVIRSGGTVPATNEATVQRDGFFSRLMELERRKNAAIFGMFRR